MVPFRKPSWLALLVLALTFVTKAAIVGSPAARAESGVEAPGSGPADSNTDANTVTSDAGKPKKCKKLRRREDWRTMSKNDKLAYIDAVKCLQRLKPAIGIPHARSRFDEFQGLHITMMSQIHLVGQFLPWHRLLLYWYEKTLNDACNYKGAQPYWDWTYDNKDFTKSAVFDPKYGFGNIPKHHRAPITDGPFAKYHLVFGIGAPFNLSDHIIERGFNSTQLKYISAAEIKRVSSMPVFEEFRVQIEGWPVTSEPRPHDGGHYAVGGEMGDFYSSPGDPLFYLHHSNIDRIWWKWQNAGPNRVYAISGRTTWDPPYKNVTLDYMLEIGNLAAPTPIRDVMDVEKSLCYTYV